MDTKKIGAFLKQCRKEKNLTQEQLAEKFGVSARTVSRWETGINMPDLSVLVQLAEYYDVEMRELLDGERSQTMNKDMKETLDKVAVYEAVSYTHLDVYKRQELYITEKLSEAFPKISFQEKEGQEVDVYKRQW